MELDYQTMAKLIDVRIKQINDASLYHEYFNKEYRELSNIRKSVGELILIERIGPDNYQTDVKKSECHLEPSEMNPETAETAETNEAMDLLAKEK